MVSSTVKKAPDNIYESLKCSAHANRRSITGELLAGSMVVHHASPVLNKCGA